MKMKSQQCFVAMRELGPSKTEVIRVTTEIPTLVKGFKLHWLSTEENPRIDYMCSLIGESMSEVLKLDEAHFIDNFNRIFIFVAHRRLEDAGEIQVHATSM